MASTAEETLQSALERAGFGRSRPGEIVILDSTGPSPKGNERVHESTNRLILALLAKGELGRCIHVTGDARALIDPFHRDLCAAMARRGTNTFDVLYQLPENHRSDFVVAIQWNLERWGSKKRQSWQEKFLTIDTIGKRAVDMRAYDAADEIQYSVFGNRYVQLQGPHGVDAMSKPIWLLDAPRLNEFLTERAIDRIHEAKDVKEAWFRDFVLSLTGVLARFLLRVVHDQPSIDRDGLLGDRRLVHSPEHAPTVLRVLETMEFLARADDQKMTITLAGKEFLSAS